MRKINLNNQMLVWLRQNARISLTKLSHKTSLPVSTLHDHLRHFEKEGVFRHVTLVDFTKLGYATKAMMMIKCRHKKSRLLKHLDCNLHVNNLVRINNGYDYFLECIFTNLKELESFVDNLEEKYSSNVKVFFVVEEIKKEEFMAMPQMAEIVGN